MGVFVHVCTYANVGVLWCTMSCMSIFSRIVGNLIWPTFILFPSLTTDTTSYNCPSINANTAVTIDLIAVSMVILLIDITPLIIDIIVIVNMKKHMRNTVRDFNYGHMMK